MSRYFIELGYQGANYAGFQIQNNANSIQHEVEQALKTVLREPIHLTCSSRTDAGVHAICNYFHFDCNLSTDTIVGTNLLSSLNALLPGDIAINRIYQVSADQHSRFSAKSREYHYFIYQSKNPFLFDRACFYPYKLDLQKLNEAARVLLEYHDFTSFSKKNTQVKSFECQIFKSSWLVDRDTFIYTVKANRFLRGMVKGLVGTMLKVGTGKISLQNFREIIASKDSSQANFAVPSKGLFLIKVEY